MQEMGAWLIASFLTVAIFITGIGARVGSISKRSEKQDLNLAGDLVMSYISEDPGGKIIIDEEAFARELGRRIRSGNYLGVIISYPDRVFGMSSRNTVFEEVSDKDGPLSKKERKFYVDKAASEIVSSVLGQGNCVEIETESSRNLREGLSDKFFNELGDTADFFLISKAGENYVVSGFSLQFG